jgi:ribosomal protein S18 acetylase RimI-like enzyme
MTAPGDAMVDAVALRPATEADREFLLAVYGSSRDEELSHVAWAEGQREAFLRLQFDLQDAEYHRVNPSASFDVIEVGGRPAGRLYVGRRPGHLRIVDIALLPEFRGAGLGRRLIAELQEEAGASGCVVSIHVEVHNRAARLYERLGFVGDEVVGVYRRMQWTRT